MSLALKTKNHPANFADNQMYSHGARAASVLSTPSYFSSFENQYKFIMG